MLYSFELEGEDHTRFVWDCTADNEEAAYDKLDIVYPDARVISCHTEEELRSIENDRYHYHQQMYDDGYYYDY